MPRQIEISPDVAAIVGDALTDYQRDNGPDDYVCTTCGEPDHLSAAPTAVVVTTCRPANLHRVRFAHAACCPSTHLTVFANPVLHPETTVSACCYLRHPDRPEQPAAALLIAPTVHLFRTTAQPDQRCDRYVSGLIADGFALLTDPDQPLPAAPTLSAHLSLASEPDAAHVSVNLTQVGTVFDGTLNTPPGWQHAVTTARRVAVITSTAMTLPNRAHNTAMATTPAELRDAIPTGRVVGALATLANTDTPHHAAA